MRGPHRAVFLRARLRVIGHRQLGKTALRPPDCHQPTGRSMAVVMAQRSTHDSAPPRLPEKPPQTNLPSTPIALITQTPKIGKTHPHSRCPFTVPGTLKRRAPANRGHTTNRVGDTPHAPFPPPTSIQKCLLLETPQKPSEKTSDLSSSPKPRKSAKPTANHGARHSI